MNWDTIPVGLALLAIALNWWGHSREASIAGSASLAASQFGAWRRRRTAEASRG